MECLKNKSKSELQYIQSSCTGTIPIILEHLLFINCCPFGLKFLHVIVMSLFISLAYLRVSPILSKKQTKFLFDWTTEAHDKRCVMKLELSQCTWIWCIYTGAQEASNAASKLYLSYKNIFRHGNRSLNVKLPLFTQLHTQFRGKLQANFFPKLV